MLNVFVMAMVGALVLSLSIPVNVYAQQTIDCERDNQQECKPNKRIIIYAVFEKSTGRALDLQTLLEGSSVTGPPIVVDFPIERNDISDTQETVITSFEYTNQGGRGLVNALESQISDNGFLDDAVFIRITIFDTWHHFGEGDLKPCEILKVVERGTLDL